MASNGEDRVHGSSRVKELLEDRNKLGETPIYTAGALGQTTMAKFFNTKVEDIIHHFQRNDGISILHIAVIGQHFETAIWLLGKEKQLAKQKEQNDLTSLHLLAKMPDAFRSSSCMGRLKDMGNPNLGAGPGCMHDSISCSFTREIFLCVQSIYFEPKAFLIIML
ncbi:isoform 2 of ankyrin repeat-containing protein npr4 [Fagus crenata]